MRRLGVAPDYEEAFAELYPVVLRVAYRALGDLNEAEDVAAEALGRAWASWRRIRDLDHRDAWVMRVALNLSVDILRRRGRATRAPLVTDVDRTVGVDDRLVIHHALARLPRRQRDVLALRFLADMSEQEVAELLHISTGSVKQHVHRGVARLRTLLDDQPLEVRLAVD